MKDPKRDELPIKARPDTPQQLQARVNKPLSAREYLKLYKPQKDQRYAET
jgi:hypothetical protein